MSGATEDKAFRRVHGLGQQKEVSLYRLVTLNTIEERMLELEESLPNGNKSKSELIHLITDPTFTQQL